MGCVASSERPKQKKKKNRTKRGEPNRRGTLSHLPQAEVEESTSDDVKSAARRGKKRQRKHKRKADAVKEDVAHSSSPSEPPNHPTRAGAGTPNPLPSAPSGVGTQPHTTEEEDTKGSVGGAQSTSDPSVGKSSRGGKKAVVHDPSASSSNHSTHQTDQHAKARQKREELMGRAKLYMTQCWIDSFRHEVLKYPHRKLLDPQQTQALRTLEAKLAEQSNPLAAPASDLAVRKRTENEDAGVMGNADRIMELLAADEARKLSLSAQIMAGGGAVDADLASEMSVRMGSSDNPSLRSVQV